MAKKPVSKTRGVKKPSERIEPHFGSGASKSADIRVDKADRVAVSSGSKSKKPSGKKAANSRKKGRSSRSGAKRRSGLVRFLRGSIYWGSVLSIWGILVVGGILGYYASRLPQSSQWQVPQRPPNARIVAASGELIANRGATGGEATVLSNMSPYIPMAVIAIEDHRFKSHFGFDPIGFTRAMVANIMAGRLVQGGSTLTQQLAKNLFLKPERTFERKVQELILAAWLETKYSKDEILEIYLNRVYFGSGATGVDAASRRYFGKSARDVSLAEAALLAGLLKAPSKLSPAKSPKKAQDRAQVVLAAMRREGFITISETTKALSMQANKAKKFWSGSEHYVADLVMREVKQVFGEMKHDIIVDTTLDLSLQKIAHTEIASTLAKKGKKLNVTQGAMIALDGNGAIRAMIGGREYAESQFNRAIDAKRQPGSSFKPFVYLEALEAGRTPESIRQDAPVRIGNWTPKNYDKKYRGPVSLDFALTKSLNTVSAQLTMEVGPRAIVQTAQRMGIQSKLNPNASIALGTSEVTLNELTAGYVPLANGGYRVTPHVIKRIKNMDGEILYERRSGPADQVVGPRELGMMNAMLRNVVEKGTGKAAKIPGWQVAGKTGTSQNSRDALFVGYTANLISGVWYGNDNGKPTKKVTGGSIPAESWGAIMAKAHKSLAIADLPGNYLANITVVPTARPNRPSDQRPKIPLVVGTRLADKNAGDGRRPLAEIGGNANTRDQRQKPKSILDILFGG